MTSIASRTSPFLASALLAIASVAAAAPGDSSSPIRVVRVGHGNVPAMKNNIRGFVSACRVVMKLPASTVGLPSDAELAKLALVEEEELFDGQMWAKYETRREIGADASQGCRLTLFVHRAAVVERTCASRVRGQNALVGELMDLEHPSGAAPEIEEDTLPSSSCGEKRRPLNREGVPSTDAGGARCQWSADVLAKAMGGKPGEGGQGADTCVYEKQPDYYFGGHKRPVVLMTRSSSRSATGADISAIFGSVPAAGNLKLDAFSDGQAIPASRFTRAAVEAFVKLPSRTAVGNAP